MAIVILIVATLLQTLITGFCLWVAAKMTGEDAQFEQMLISAFLASLVRWIPIAGPLLSFILLMWLVRHFTTASGIGVFFIILVSYAVGFGVLMGILLMFA